jgi:hypothetical protein
MAYLIMGWLVSYRHWFFEKPVLEANFSPTQNDLKQCFYSSSKRVNRVLSIVIRNIVPDHLRNGVQPSAFKGPKKWWNAVTDDISTILYDLMIDFKNQADILKTCQNLHNFRSTHFSLWCFNSYQSRRK